MRRIRLVVLLSGRGSNFQAIVRAISDGRVAADIVSVITDRPDAAGIEYARSCGLATQCVIRDRKTESLTAYMDRLRDTVRAAGPELVVLAGFMKILSGAFVSAFTGKLINIHPSLLPSFKGLHAQQQAVDAGVRVAGCTVHYVTEEVDGGPIIAQGAVPVLPDDTAETLSARILTVEHQILPAVVGAIARGEVSLQVHGGRHRVAIAKSLDLSEQNQRLVSISEG